MTLNEDQLRAFVDGELDAPEHARIAGLVATDRALAQRVDELRAEDARLRAALLHGLTLPPNSELEPRVARRRWNERRAKRAQLVAAAVFAVSVGGAGGWYARGSTSAPPMQDAMDAYRVFALDTRGAVELPSGDPQQLERALKERLGRVIAIPRLESHGFTLEGGRVLATNDGPAVFVLYRDAGGAKLSFYWRPSTRTSPGTRGAREEDGLLTRYWFRGGYGVALVGDATDPRTVRVQASVEGES
jgi:anti-sigma factor RsiW